MGQNGSSESVLTVKQEQLITLLVAGVAIVTAAKNVGVGQTTAHRWLKLPEFQAAYKAAQRAIFDQALTGLMGKVEKAINTLDRNMSGEDVPPATQVRSAQIVLEQAVNIFKVSELEDQVKELQTMIKERQV